MIDKQAVNLKKIEDKAPELVSLAKTAAVSLSKLNLEKTKARVVLVLDASGSMNGRYSGGVVQEIVNRVIPLAVNFDDDAEIDMFAFGDKPVKLPSISLDNFREAIEGKWKSWDVGARINNELDTMKLVMNDHHEAHASDPTYVIFISDGGVGSRKAMQDMIRECSNQAVFWQFMGIGGHNYGALESLDTLDKRTVDNANFFAVDKLNDMSDGELYDALLSEFPDWISAAKQAGILNQDGSVGQLAPPVRYSVAAGNGRPELRSTSTAQPEEKKGFFSRLLGR